MGPIEREEIKMLVRWQSHDFLWSPLELKKKREARGNQRTPNCPRNKDLWRRTNENYEGQGVCREETLQAQDSKSVIWEMTRPRRADPRKDQVKGQ